jgi:hypothetical protein
MVVSNSGCSIRSLVGLVEAEALYSLYSVGSIDNVVLRIA